MPSIFLPARGRSPGGRPAQNFHYITCQPLCQEENDRQIAQKFIPKFVHFAYCIFVSLWYTIIKKGTRERDEP